MESSKILEIVIAIAFMGLAVAVFVEVRDLPPGLIDPLGSAPVPRWTAAILFVLSLAMLVRVFLPSKELPGAEPVEADDIVVERIGAGVGVALLTVLYVVVLASRAIGFSVLTAAFVFALVVLLSKNRVRGTWTGLALGIPVGFGCEYLFTQVFVVDLPTWW